MRPSLGLALMAMAIALPAHAKTDLDNTMPVAPEPPTMEAFHDGVDACRDQDCRIRSSEIERMAWWVTRGNRLALRLSFAASRSLDAGSDNAHLLAQSYGGVIKRDPASFLALARDEGAPAMVVITDAATTADGLAGDRTAQARELAARRDALMRVTDPALAGLRDQCVVEIDLRLESLTPRVSIAGAM